MVLALTGRDEVEMAAVPPTLRGTVQIVVDVVMSVKVTLPVGAVGELLPGAFTVTVAVNVTDWFRMGVFVEEPTEVAVEPLLTACPRDSEPLLFEKFPSALRKLACTVCGFTASVAEEMLAMPPTKLTGGPKFTPSITN